jgi:hypothetical protein
MLTAKFDDRKRVVIPQGKPGQIVAIVENPDGTITLSPMKATERKPSILDGLKPLTDAEAKKAFGPNAEFDELEHHCATVSHHIRPDFE